ncbi:MAG: hypothetical protein ACJ77L_08945 [Solirubrobacteraceae bacterium]
MRVHAEREVGAPPNAVFAFLADLENHWGLAADWVQVRALHRDDHGPARTSRGSWSRATAAAARSSGWAPRCSASGRSIGSCGRSSVAG